MLTSIQIPYLTDVFCSLYGRLPDLGYFGLRLKSMFQGPKTLIENGWPAILCFYFTGTRLQFCRCAVKIKGTYSASFTSGK